MIESLVQLFHYRVLVQMLILRDLKARYRGTTLGFLWSFMNPLIQMTIYVLVFSVYMRINTPNYPIFLLSGILPWAAFSSGLSEASLSIIANGSLIKKVYLPSQIFPLVSVGSHMVHYLFSIPILLLFLILYGTKFSWALLFFPLLLLVQLIFSYSLALLISSLMVHFRDLFHIVPNVLMIWFFLTPIFYPISMVPSNYQFLVKLNPMARLMTAYQEVFYYNRVPSFYNLVGLLLLSIALLMISLSFFETRKEVFAEEV